MRIRKLIAVAVLVGAVAPVQAHDQTWVWPSGSPNFKPRFLGAVTSNCYRTDAHDLLTAGLGKTGLGSAAAPGFANPLLPTSLELRRRAIHTNYRAVLDPTTGGGYGTLYGPNVDKNGNVTASEGYIHGCEHLAFADDGSGKKNVTLMVQIPDSFDPKNACIVTGTASGSRGIYGAIGASGEWGLKRGCAVAYTDKGTGNGLHDLATNVVGLIDGIRYTPALAPLTADGAGTDSHFTAALTDAERAAYNTAFPNRVAYKHAHSQQNPEADWGRNTLQAVVFAFYALNEQFGKPLGNSGFKRIAIDRRNTLVIASAISNGGTGGLAAAEQDRFGLIDGVAVTEPNAQPDELHGLRIQQGTNTVETIGKPLYDYFTYGNLYQPCAAIAVGAAAPAYAFLPAVQAQNRCAGLKAKGLLTKTTLAEQASEALEKLHKYGWGTESDVLHASHYRFATNAIAVTYANASGRFSVADNVCGFSFANTDAAGNVISQEIPLPPLTPTQPLPQPTIFATGNGVPPTTRVNIVYNDSVGGAKLDLLAVSPSTTLSDFALDGAICHRNLAEGRDIVTGAPLTGAMKEMSDRVREGIDDVLLEADLRGKPAIIVAGRADALVPINHASRAYFGASQLEGRGHGRRHWHHGKHERGENRNVRYVEVTNAQHFDAFLPGGPVFGGYEKRFVPLHVYLIRSLDWMYDHLKNGKKLPPSQVVRATPRCPDPSCAVAPDITAANVPQISDNPPAGDLITMSRRTLHVPE
jgi:hydroxybutyrate-dimer hydrolase